MKIFIDARMRKIGGTYTYTISLLKEILKLDSLNNNYTILYNKRQEQISPEKTKVIETTSSNPIYWMFWDNFILPRVIKENNIDVFHSFRRPDILNIKTKKIFTNHSAYPFLFPKLQSIEEKLYWTRSQKKAVNAADAVLSVSETDKNSLSRVLDVDPQKIFVTHLAVSKEFKKATDRALIKKIRNKYKLPEKYFLFIGSFYLFKNIPNIIRAFAFIKSEMGISHKLVLVGPKGSGAYDVYKTIKKTGLEDEVILTGAITENVPVFYSEADIFLFPTLYDSFGIPVLEAMACGVPTIVSTAGALSEVAGDAALKYDPTDITGIADGIKKLLYDKDLRKKMIRKGYDQVKKFSWERCAKETIAVYNDVYSKK